MEGALGIAARPDELLPFTNAEMHVLEGLLLDRGAKDYPGLSASLSAARATSTVAFYTQDTAWDLHRLLLSVLASAESVVDTLYTQIATPASSCADLSASLSDVQYTMDRLHFLVHSSSISAHMKSIEAILSDAMDISPPPGTHDTARDGVFGVMPSLNGDLDLDDGVTDSTIEIALAHKEKRVGEECLWLAVRYQTALESLTALDSLPTARVKFTLCEVGGEDTTTTEMHDWKDVIRIIYCPRANATVANEHNIDTSCEEAILAMEKWASTPENRGRPTHILRSSRHKFYGSWHAEAVLGTLRHVSQCHMEPNVAPNDVDLTAFEYTINSIGVSKRCCPVCTKLLQLLEISLTSEGEDNVRYRSPAMVSSSHQNFYPTALPPYLPQAVAFQLLAWLEGLVKNAVERLVQNGRLARARSQEAARQGKEERAKSADSKGDSPGKKGKRKRAKAPGVGSIGTTRRLGL